MTLLEAVQMLVNLFYVLNNDWWCFFPSTEIHRFQSELLANLTQRNAFIAAFLFN